MSRPNKPVLSMTGFGAGEARIGSCRVVVEVKSVNHRYLDAAVKGPREYAGLEVRVLEAVRARLRRGKVDVFLSRALDLDGAGTVRANLPLARGYREALEAIRTELKLQGEVTLSMIAGLRDVVSAAGTETDPEAEWPGVERALSQALERIGAMRQVEGARLCADLLALGRELRRLAGEAAARAPQVVLDHRARLAERLKKLLGDTGMEPARLDQEIGLLADRADVHEELVRLESHLEQFDAMLAGGGEIGRKLDFLLQEMGREINTLGSKANDAALARTVVELKTVAERVREQIQNVE